MRTEVTTSETGGEQLNNGLTAKKHKLKIQFVFNFCAHYRIRLFEILAKKYDISFLFFSEGGEKYYDGLGGLHLGDFKGRYLKGFNLTSKLRINPELFRELFSKETNLILKCINGPFPLLLAYLAARFRKLPFILWTGIWHDLETPFHRIAARIVHRVFHGSDAIVVYGDHVKRYLIEKGVDGRKIFPAYQAHDTEKFLIHVPPEEIEKLRDELGITTPNVILYVGRFVEEKGLEHLLTAYEKMNRDDVSLLLVGAGNTKAALRKRVKNLRNAFIEGYVKNDLLYRYYALADILVLPSITTATFKEPWGFVVNEAMCQSCAVVVTDAVGAGMGGLVEEGVNGFIVPERNSAALANAIARLLDNPTLREGFQERALEKMKTWDHEFMSRGFDAAIAYALKHHDNGKSD